MKTLIFFVLYAVLVPAWANDQVVTVEKRSVVTKLTAVAEVEAIHTVIVSAQIEGIVTDFHVVPGARIRAGEELGQLTGPEQSAAIQAAQAQVDKEKAALNLAKKNLTSAKQTYPNLTTREQLNDARAAVIDARAGLQAAQAKFNYLQQGSKIRAPTDGSVIEVSVADGERVSAGTPLVRIQPSHELWLRAIYFGRATAKLKLGMTGNFFPIDGSSPIPVTLRSIIEPARPDGGRSVACGPSMPNPGWYSGEAGRLELTGPEQELPAVPTAALIMDQGQWWVLVHEAQGDHPQKVEPSSTQGDWTLIESGIEPGQQVIVKDAYLLYHRDFSRQYQPPD